MEITDSVKFALFHHKYTIFMENILFQKKCRILVKSALFTEFPLQNQQNSAVIVYVSGQRGREGDFYPKIPKISDIFIKTQHSPENLDFRG